MIVGGYDLHLYCDGEFHKELHPNKTTTLDAEYFGRNEDDVRRQARADGWRFTLNECFCKDCQDDRKKHRHRYEKK